MCLGVFFLEFVFYLACWLFGKLSFKAILERILLDFAVSYLLTLLGVATPCLFSLVIGVLSCLLLK